MAHPAPPILASALLHTAPKSYDRQAVGTGHPAVDTLALAGGFKYGSITAVSGALGTGKTLVALHVLTTHLLAHPESQVAVIDTTGSFSPFRMYDVVLARLLKEQEVKERALGGTKVVGGQEGEDLRRKAEEMLDRVQVMRVFDFYGVIDAVGEIRERMEDFELTKERKVVEIGWEVEQKGEREIADSEDEIESEDVEMEEQGSRQKITFGTTEGPQAKATNRDVGIIVIDTITNVRPPAQAQQHDPTNSFIRQPRKPDDNVSIFSSTLGKPALGKSFAYCVDMQVFLSKIPRTREDAEEIYGGEGGGGGTTGGAEMASVMEVIADRSGEREGRWAAFMIDGAELKSAYSTETSGTNDGYNGIDKSLAFNPSAAHRTWTLEHDHFLLYFRTPALCNETNSISEVQNILNNGFGFGFVCPDAGWLALRERRLRGQGMEMKYVALEKYLWTGFTCYEDCLNYDKEGNLMAE
ncbi:MAG: hypothetical protein M1827_004819 [Pycnora praestabilis]|nr:MAG: hypothetical protein M1827_004819 [Pycnora praestabilis]